MPSVIREIITRRNLISELVRKDLKMRYARLSLGFFWSILSPFLMVIAFYIAFSVILKVKIEESPFILYLMSAIFPWNFFQGSLSSAATSLIDNRNLLKESGFPRYLIPVSIVLTNAVILLPSLLIIIISSLFFLKGLPVFIFFLPAALLLHLTLTIALSIIVAILYVQWRDIKFILDAGLVFLFYLTPVFYSLSLVKESLPPLVAKAYFLNPFVGILCIYRIVLLKGFWAITAGNVDLFAVVAVPLIAAVMFLTIAIHLYKKNKHVINDYLSY